MSTITLAEKVIDDFSKIRIKKSAVKVPRLTAKNTQKANFQKKKSKSENIPTSLLVRLLIKNALENAKKEKKETRAAAIKYKILHEEKDGAGGYGKTSPFYGAKIKSSYINYEKLFGYLGKFRAKGSFYSDAPTERLNNGIESKSFELVGREAMDNGARYAKYFFPRVADFHANLLSLVPVAGMGSAEWEQFKLMMILDPVMYSLKSKTA